MKRVFGASLAFCILPTLLFAQRFNGNVAAPPSHASGSNIVGAGARALGMGGAFVAIADDATAASWNPAGLRILSKPEISLVYDNLTSSDNVHSDTVYRDPDFTYRVKALSDTLKSRDGGLGFASATFPFDLKSRRVVAQLSYRRLLSFPRAENLATYQYEVPGDSGTETSVLTTRTINRDAGGISDYTLSAATQLIGGLDGGISINYMRANVHSQIVNADVAPSADFATDTRLSYRLSAVRIDAGLLYRIGEHVSLGAVYHGGGSGDFNYNGSQQIYADYPGLGISPVASYSHQSTAKWPSGYALGIAVRPVERLTLSADYTATQWSKATIREFQTTVMNYSFDENGRASYAPSVNQPVLNEGFPNFPFLGTRSLFDQFDTTSLRAGAEFILFAPHGIDIPIRAGYFLDDQVVNNTGTSQPTYRGFSVGTGVGFKNFQIDAAFVRTRGKEFGTEGFENFGQPTGMIDDHTDFRSNRILVSMIYRFE